MEGCKDKRAKEVVVPMITDVIKTRIPLEGGYFLKLRIEFTVVRLERCHGFPNHFSFREGMYL